MPWIVAGCLFVGLNTLLPWAALLLLWRRHGESRALIPLAAVIAPTISFLFGGAWYVGATWLLDGLDVVSAWRLFLFAGGFAVALLGPGSLVVLTAAAVWSRFAPASYARLTQRPAE